MEEKKSHKWFTFNCQDEYLFRFIAVNEHYISAEFIEGYSVENYFIDQIFCFYKKILKVMAV